MLKNQLFKDEWKQIYNHDEIKKLKKDINAITKKIANKVKNENHHISKNIVNNFDYIFMEDLTLKGMQKLWGNKIKNLSLSQLTNMIKYKADNQGKIFTKINKFFIFFFTILNEDLILQKKDVEPSTKTCSSCKQKYNILLSERIFSCPHCKTTLDRDINAAINILNEGISIELAKIESIPLANSSGDLKHFINNKISKIVDGISYGFKETSPFMVG